MQSIRVTRQCIHGKVLFVDKYVQIKSIGMLEMNISRVNNDLYKIKGGRGRVSVHASRLHEYYLQI